MQAMAATRREARADLVAYFERNLEHTLRRAPAGAHTLVLSDEALYLELAGDADALAESGIEAVYRTGDCVAPRWLVDTVFDGHRLAREIDSPDPRRPLPYLRERRLLAETSASLHLSH